MSTSSALNLTSWARSHAVLVFLWNQKSLNSWPVWTLAMASHIVDSTCGGDSSSYNTSSRSSSRNPSFFIRSSRSSFPEAPEPDAFGPIVNPLAPARVTRQIPHKRSPRMGDTTREPYHSLSAIYRREKEKKLQSTRLFLYYSWT
jgi:hypothetical protein